MTDSNQEFADRIARTVALVRSNPYMKGQEPTPKQYLFLADPREEVLYGGAAGGGKSWSLLAAALMYVHVPYYSALLLRRTIPDLSQPGGLIPMSHEWLAGTDAKWSSVKKTWTFPSGATLAFGHLEVEKDMYRYQGGEYSFIGWDEVTQIPEDAYKYLLSRLRQRQEISDAGVPLRCRASANPGGTYHEWVMDHFLNERHPDRYFIPSTYKENPHLDREAYAKQLAKLPAVQRAQLEDGNWDITVSGNMFNPLDIRVVDKPRTSQFRRCRVWDLATGTDKSDWTVGMLMSVDDGVIRIEHVWREKAEPGRMEAAMKALADMDGRHVPILIEQERGSAGTLYLRHLRRDVLKGFVVIAQTPTGHKVDRAMLPSAMCSNGQLEIVDRSWTSDVLSELSQFPDGAHDDIVDTVSYGAAWLTKPGRARKKATEKGETKPSTPRQRASSAAMLARSSGGASKRWGVSSPDWLRSK